MRRFPTLLMVLLFLPLHWGCSALQSRMTPSRTLRFSLEDLAGQIEKDLSRSIEKGRGLSVLPPEPLGAESPRLGLYLCDRLKVELGRRGFTVGEKGGRGGTPAAAEGSRSTSSLSTRTADSSPRGASP